ncbi:hypothetical protein GQ53DRAFT_855314 [Thozetella sp. PMI_491]|nr:hypothetical protein GQ53DRAFT_855314 [Thozetella sp. PMI_491]
MATGKKRTRTPRHAFRPCASTSRNAATLPRLLFSLLTIPSLLTAGIANALCNADFDYPTESLSFYYLDTINVTYRSNFPDPQLYLYCSPSNPVQKFNTSPSPFSASTLVQVKFSSNDPCYFSLQSSSIGCTVNSSTFNLYVNQRFGGQATTLGLLVAPTDQPPPNPDGSLSPGVKAGLGVAITGIAIAIGAMVAFFYFRRRRRIQDANVAGVILDHDRRNGRRGPEKPLPRPGTESMSSGRSEAPLNPVQPVFDGFPGSTGYDDVRSLHSSTHLHSPTWPHSPVSSNPGSFYPSERSTEIEELTAARLQSSATLPAVVSYGPNRVTPTLTPRPSDLNVRAGSISIDSREGIPPMPPMPSMPDIPVASSYVYHQSAPLLSTTPSPPKKTIPLVVSYGPNKVTPTPVFKSSIPPPDDAVMRNIEPEPQHQELDGAPRRFSFDVGDEGFAEPYSAMGPLPPYASTADFYAMEKGAIRKLAEPLAQAELPPTKDGYYHDRVDVQEYELQGAAPQNEPQLPFNPFKNQPLASGSAREIDEQKFLLDDAEMAHLREQKRQIRAAQQAAAAAAAAEASTSSGPSTAPGEPGESYEMTQTAFSRPSMQGPQ